MKFKFLLVFILPFFGTSQVEQLEKSEPCFAAISWRYTEKIDLYDMPNGRVFKSIQNDQVNDDYISLVILAETNDFFYGAFVTSRNKNSYEGWIKKNSYIGGYSIQEEDYQNITLYINKDDPASKINLTDWKSDFVTIIHCENNWKMISLEYKGEQIQAWIESSKLQATE